MSARSRAASVLLPGAKRGTYAARSAAAVVAVLAVAARTRTHVCRVWFDLLREALELGSLKKAFEDVWRAFEVVAGFSASSVRVRGKEGKEESRSRVGRTRGFYSLDHLVAAAYEYLPPREYYMTPFTPGSGKPTWEKGEGGGHHSTARQVTDPRTTHHAPPSPTLQAATTSQAGGGGGWVTKDRRSRGYSESLPLNPITRAALTVTGKVWPPSAGQFHQLSIIGPAAVLLSFMPTPHDSPAGPETTT